MSGSAAAGDAELVIRLRAAGCVFAEDEAAVLRERAGQDAELLERLAERRIAGEPLEPLVGWVDFGALRLAVGPGVFVPRQRTLELAAHAVAEVRVRQERAPHPVFVEAFAGVAPVASMVRAEVPGARVFAAEADPAARALAVLNLSRGAALRAERDDERNDTAEPDGSGDGARAHRVGVFDADVLVGVPEHLRRAVDVIAAVPPYVPDGERQLLPREARDHEPGSALFGGADGLLWVRSLIDQAPSWLAPGGCLLVELHRDQCAAAADQAGGAGLIVREPVRPSRDLTRVLALHAAP